MDMNTTLAISMPGPGLRHRVLCGEEKHGLGAIIGVTRHKGGHTRVPRTAGGTMGVTSSKSNGGMSAGKWWIVVVGSSTSACTPVDCTQRRHHSLRPSLPE